MPKDNVGWSSKGERVKCPRCPNDDATLITSVIYGKRTKEYYCEICSAQWPDDDDDEIRSRR